MALYTQADIDALKILIKSGKGSETTRHGDTVHQHESRSMKELLDLLRLMERDVNGTTARPRRTVAAFSNGC